MNGTYVGPYSRYIAHTAQGGPPMGRRTEKEHTVQVQERYIL